MTPRKTALVTGATGFVGSNLCRLLLERGYRVRALVRPGSAPGNLPGHPNLEIAPGDLTDAPSVMRAARGSDEVYHVAADYRFWARDPRELYESNVRGTENVLRAAEAANASRIVHTSTVGTIGLADQPEPCDEETRRDPGQFTSHYKRSKLEAEEIALERARRGLPVVIVNPSTPIGPWDCKPTPTGRIIVDFVNGAMPAYVETGLNFVHVRDVAEGHLLAAQKGRVGERYILGGRNLTMREFLQRVATQCQRLSIAGAPSAAPAIRVPYCVAWLTGMLSTAYADAISRKPPQVPIEAVKMSKRFMFFDSSKAIRELGLPQSPVDSAIAEALDWFSRNGYFRALSRKKRKGMTHASTA